MKSNFCNKSAVCLLAAFAGAFVITLWPTTVHSQDSSRRDRSERYRRESSDRSRSSTSESARPSTATRPSTSASGPARPPTPAPPIPAASARTGTAGPAGQTAGPAEPNTVVQPAEAPSRQELPARTSSRRGGQDDQWAKYDIILTRNIFSRQRAAPQRQEVRTEPVRALPNPEAYLLLKGVVQENGQFLAFVEDTQGGSVLRLRQGDRVARGAVKSLTLDALEYEFEGKTVPVSVGSDLEGGRGAAASEGLLDWSSLPSSAAQPTTGPQPPAAPSANEAEILKRLMEQRKQQLGQ